jgi:hypothetical protein
MAGRFQIKLSALFVLILAISLPLGCIAYMRHQIDDFHRAAAPFEKVSGRQVQASGDGMAIVYGRYGLTTVNLREAKLDDAGLLKLKGDLERLPELHALDLARTAIGDDGLEALKNLKALHSLILTETQVTDAGLVHLRQLRGLTSLALAGTKVTDAGVEELKQSLPECEIFR